MTDDEHYPDGLLKELRQGATEETLEEQIQKYDDELDDYIVEDGEEEYGDTEQLLNDMKGRGVNIVQEHNGDEHMYFLSDDVDDTYRWEKEDDHYKFAIISDTHLGSDAEQLESLNDFYDKAVDEDVDVVFHAGDISDGCEIYRGHKQHKKPEAIGWGRLKDYVVENYPEREGLDTLFLEGNHDHQMFKETGIRFGEEVADERDDLHYIGDCYANIDLGEIDMDLVHPSGGAPYTLGYRAQTWLRDKPEEAKADITVFGHLHQVLQAETEGSMAFYAGAWQGQTPYLDRKGHKAKAGGWLVEMDVDDGDIEALKTEFVEYDMDSDTDFSADDISSMIEE